MKAQYLLRFEDLCPTMNWRVWEPVENGKNGYLGCAVVLGPSAQGAEKQTDDSYLFVTNAKPGEPLRYYVGSTWDHAGHVANAEAWGETTRQLAARIAAPLKVALAAGSGALGPAAPAAPKPAP